MNKVDLGLISSLPTYFKRNKTYVVFNQIRTFNSSRFISLKEGNNVIESRIDDHLFIKLLHLGINDILFSLNHDEKIILYKKAYEKECINKSINLAYTILKLSRNYDKNKKEIECIKKEIKHTLNNISYTVEQKHIDNGVKDVLDEIC